MKNSKVKNIVSAVALCMAVIMSVSLIGALFSGSSSGSGTSSNKKPSNTVTPSTNTIIGVSWDRSESTALTRLTTDNGINDTEASSQMASPTP